MSLATNIARLVAFLSLVTVLTGTASAGEGVVKLGMIGEFSGPFAEYGLQMYNGMKTYIKEHGDVVAGKKIEVIQKDTTGPAPDVAKRLAQELVTRDNVDILVGFGLTPNALAVAPVATEAKKPMIIMNAATSIVTTKSPYDHETRDIVQTVYIREVKKVNGGLYNVEFDRFPDQKDPGK